MFLSAVVLGTGLAFAAWWYTRQEDPRGVSGLMKVKTCKACNLGLPVSHFPTVRSSLCNGCSSLRPRKAHRKPGFERRIFQNQLSRMRLCLKRAGVKISSAESRKLLGADCDTLSRHLVCQFKQGMTRDNYGSQWHVDHKIPISAFNLSLPESRRKAFHYTNLQPMNILDNISKGCSLKLNQ